MRTVHRVLAIFVALPLIWIALTGMFIDLIGLRAQLAHAPATDPTIQATRVGTNGPPNFQVIREPDYSANPLPHEFDFDAALTKLLTSARKTVGNAPIRFVEFRMLNGKPVGQIGSEGQVYGFDTASGTIIGPPTKLTLLPLATPSLYNDVKDLHRLAWFHPLGLGVDALIALLLLAMIVVGIVMYVRLLKARAGRGLHNPFWSGGGGWRALHRGVSVVASLFLAIIAVSGFVLSSGSVPVAINKLFNHNQRPGLTKDMSSSLAAADLSAMLHTTLNAYRKANGDVPVKVLRLRYFAGMPQGIVVAGDNADTQQLAFNAATGDKASLSGPGYPDTNQTYGWQVAQIAKKIHRGDWMGPVGRYVDLIAGAALLYLTISGLVMYVELWSRRRKMGRNGLLWSDPKRIVNDTP
ncbi:PepSY-associated TM helix domain-containing protein [Caballeronia sp. ATUFL_M1_KS5A]|uniref:PepSY-associated TM helix domain-containing protein n=1 Tax=Caballeronia sp. ATUFL_M1_KS5A TaxID=2921778 RepID=UPI00202941CD|nr:PepSY-associated TM helix domain-containing protein [Caballeronia sp. ATUFL_M1_KS5A]